MRLVVGCLARPEGHLMRRREFHHTCERHSGMLASCRTRAAADDAGDRVTEQRIA